MHTENNKHPLLRLVVLGAFILCSVSSFAQELFFGFHGLQPTYEEDSFVASALETQTFASEEERAAAIDELRSDYRENRVAILQMLKNNELKEYSNVVHDIKSAKVTKILAGVGTAVAVAGAAVAIGVAASQSGNNDNASQSGPTQQVANGGTQQVSQSNGNSNTQEVNEQIYNAYCESLNKMVLIKVRGNEITAYSLGNDGVGQQSWTIIAPQKVGATIKQQSVNYNNRTVEYTFNRSVVVGNLHFYYVEK